MFFTACSCRQSLILRLGIIVGSFCGGLCSVWGPPTHRPILLHPQSWIRDEKHSVADDLTELSLEQLMAVEVTSVSKKSQPVAQTASAIFVITQEDIRRSGANSIPEALRMAPGLHVARIDSQKWSVTSRGFSGRFADDLLVLIDGRTVYSPSSRSLLGSARPPA